MKFHFKHGIFIELKCDGKSAVEIEAEIRLAHRLNQSRRFGEKIERIRLEKQKLKRKLAEEKEREKQIETGAFFAELFIEIANYLLEMRTMKSVVVSGLGF